MKEEIVTFDNLRQPHINGVAGMTQRVRALRPQMSFSPKPGDTSGTLWRPKSIEEVGLRARQAGERLLQMMKRSY